MCNETIVEVKPQIKPIREKAINVEVDIDTKGRKYRMYCFVERHLSPIDKGIQAAHSIVEYSNLYGENVDYVIWSLSDKTIVLLNGGSVTDLCDICKELNEWNINFSIFREEDLGSIVTSIAVLVDDRVFASEEDESFEIDEVSDKSEEEHKIDLLIKLIKSRHLAR